VSEGATASGRLRPRIKLELDGARITFDGGLLA
jgi:hypothetical protein